MELWDDKVELVTKCKKFMKSDIFLDYFKMNYILELIMYLYLLIESGDFFSTIRYQMNSMSFILKSQL